MRVLGLVCVMFCGSGCLVQDNHKDKQDSEALVDVGGDDDNGSMPWSRCERYLTKSINATPFGSSHIIARNYQHKKSCVRLHVGIYGKLQRYEMDGSPVAASMFHQISSGSFTAALVFMEDKGITCEESNNKLSLVFPERKHGHTDYKTINLHCGTGIRQLLVRIGLKNEDSDRLAITVVPRRDDERPPVYHAFDTDGEGVIKNHIKVVGVGGEKGKHSPQL